MDVVAILQHTGDRVAEGPRRVGHIVVQRGGVGLEPGGGDPAAGHKCDLVGEPDRALGQHLEGVALLNVFPPPWLGPSRSLRQYSLLDRRQFFLAPAVGQFGFTEPLSTDRDAADPRSKLITFQRMVAICSWRWLR
jgi:hypothetical protein